MRRFATFLLLVLACGVAQAEPSLTKGARVAVPLSELKPSQMQVGRSEVNANLKQWKKKAAEKGLTLRQYAEQKLVPKFSQVGIEAVVDPHGNVRPTDGHHRISALLEVAKQTGVEVPVQVKISEDYRGRTMESYAHDFVETRGKGYFTRGVMKLPATERVEHLPDSFAALKNSPMRSAMAHVFSRMHLDDFDLVDYAEFKVADYLTDHHVFKALETAGIVKPGTSHLSQALVHDPRVLEVMVNALDTPDAKRFLVGLTTGNPAKMEKRLGITVQ